ncbi:MAG: mobilization protein [Coxiellaceae bacterium]|nr:mobilization protein [Coxiellaceae bacterium]
MDKKSKKLENLKKKQDQLKAQIQAMEAAEKTREKKRDTRRKILIGAYYQDKAIKENRFDEIIKLMDGYLNRNSDRVLFDLPPLEEESSSTKSSK